MCEQKQRSKKELDDLFDDNEDAVNSQTPEDAKVKKKGGRGEVTSDFPDVDAVAGDEVFGGGTEEKKKKKKGKKGKKQENLFQDSDSENDLVDTKQVDTRASKKNKAGAGFSALLESDEEDSDPSEIEEEKDSSRFAAAQDLGEMSDKSLSEKGDALTSHTNGKVESSKGLSFSALDVGDDSENEDEADDIPIVKPKPPKKKKAKGFESAFAALDIEVDDEVEEVPADSFVSEPNESSLRMISTNQNDQSAMPPTQIAQSNQSQPKGKQKASKKKQKLADLEDAFMSLESGAEKEPLDGGAAAQTSTKKKKKAKPGGIDFDALMEELHEPGAGAKVVDMEKPQNMDKGMQDGLSSGPKTVEDETVVEGVQDEISESTTRDATESKVLLGYSIRVQESLHCAVVITAPTLVHTELH